MKPYRSYVTVEKDFFTVLRGIAKNADSCPNFSGVGLLLYDPETFEDSWYADLRPSVSCLEDVSLGSGKALPKLLEMASGENILHDGFHFFECKTGCMTHVAQYLSPPIAPEIEVNEKYGTRYRSAQYSSLVKGVILSGVVNSDNSYHVFRRGVPINEEVIDGGEEYENCV